MKTIGIIGWGAAGMMCAAEILEAARLNGTIGDVRINLFEKNASLGRKVAISWGGRCNVTTGIIDRKTLLLKYTRGADFFKTSLGKFWPRKVVEWFESHGVKLKCEDDLRVFPVSDSGDDVIGAFLQVFQEAGKSMNIHYQTPVLGVKRSNGSFEVGLAEETLLCDVLVITTGGNAYAHTGSSGDGYGLAASLGHSITTLGPSLSSFELLEDWPKKLSGIAFEKARLTSVERELSFKLEERTNGFPTSKAFSAEWPLLLTHFWISGPASFSFSSQIAWVNISKDTPLPVRLAPVADMNAAQWDTWIEKTCREQWAKQLDTILDEALPKRFVQALESIGDFQPSFLQKKAATVSREERRKLSNLLGNGIPLTLVARRAGDEFVTAGGVTLDEVNEETLESKICSGLYFAGEVLNIDGVTGWFNLQVAWATGYQAGKKIASDSLQ